MNDQDGRGKYLAVPEKSLRRANEATYVSEISCQNGEEILVFSNDFRTFDSTAGTTFNQPSFLSGCDRVTTEIHTHQVHGDSFHTGLNTDLKRDYLLLAVFAVFCCPLCGIIGLCYSLNARDSFQEDEIEAGHAEGRCAMWFSLVAIITGLTAVSIATMMVIVLVSVFPQHF